MVIHSIFGEPTGQGWVQITELAIAFVLTAVIGLERELKQRSAGVRTHTVVGFAAALFMLTSKYGFSDVINGSSSVLDPSRMAAQIVSGVGFIGAGIIFVRRGSVRGLTTAASIWLAAAVGAGAGAGLVVLAVAGTIGYFLAILVLPPVARAVSSRVIGPWPELRVHYLDGRGLLREVLTMVTQSGFLVADMATTRYAAGEEASSGTTSQGRSVEVTVQLGGHGDVEQLVSDLSELDGVLRVATARHDRHDDED